MTAKFLALADFHSLRSSYVDVLAACPKDLAAILLLGDVGEPYFWHLKDHFDVPTLGVLGNHDYPLVFTRHPQITHLGEEAASVGGLIVVGLNGSLDYNEEHRFPGYTQMESVLAAQRLPAADILISHTSPFGLHEKDGDVHAGFIGLADYIEEHAPRLHLHGHQHEWYDDMLGETRVVGIYGAALITMEADSIQVERIVALD